MENVHQGQCSSFEQLSSEMAEVVTAHYSSPTEVRKLCNLSHGDDCLNTVTLSGSKSYSKAFAFTGGSKTVKIWDVTQSRQGKVVATLGKVLD